MCFTDASMGFGNPGAFPFERRSFRPHLAICTVADGLQLPVFLFQLFLHLEIQPSLLFDSLLFEIADDTLMHSLFRCQQDDPNLARKWSVLLGRASAVGAPEERYQWCRQSLLPRSLWLLQTWCWRMRMRDEGVSV